MHARDAQLVIALLAVVVASAAVGPSARAQPPEDQLPPGTIVQEQTPTKEHFGKVSAYAGRMAWSHYDSTTGRWALMTRANGTVRQVPVAPRAGGPFDVDLGPSATGNTVAIYSRCTGEQGFVSLGCDIFEFDFASGKETAVSAANTGRSEYLPSIWKTRIAFVRTCRGTPGCKRIGANVHLVDTDKAGSSKRISPSPRAYKADEIPRSYAVELNGKHLAYAWDYNDSPDGLTSQLRLYDGKRSRVLFTTYSLQGGFEGAVVRSPSFDNRHTLHFVEMGSDPASQIVRYSLATKRLESTRGDEYGYYDGHNDFYIASLDGKLVGTTKVPGSTPTCAPDLCVMYAIRTLPTPRFYKVKQRR